MTGYDARDQARDETLPDRPCETSDLFRDYVGDGREYRGHNGECENCGEKFKESDHGDLGDAHWMHTLAIARACWERDTGPEVQALALAMDPDDPEAATDHAANLLASPWLAEYVSAAVIEALEESSVRLTRDHTMPPNKDRRNYNYRMGWWDAINKAGSVLDQHARTVREAQ